MVVSAPCASVLPVTQRARIRPATSVIINNNNLQGGLRAERPGMPGSRPALVVPPLSPRRRCTYKGQQQKGKDALDCVLGRTSCERPEHTTSAQGWTDLLACLLEGLRMGRGPSGAGQLQPTCGLPVAKGGGGREAWPRHAVTCQLPVAVPRVRGAQPHSRDPQALQFMTFLWEEWSEALVRLWFLGRGEQVGGQRLQTGPGCSWLGVFANQNSETRTLCSYFKIFPF